MYESYAMSNKNFGATSNLYRPSVLEDSKKLKKLTGGNRFVTSQLRKYQSIPLFKPGQSQLSPSSQSRKNDPPSTNENVDVKPKCCGQSCAVQ